MNHSIVKYFLLVGLVFSNSVFAQGGSETRTCDKNIIYTKTSEYPALGTHEVWKDPRGLVWGETGNMGKINHQDAVSYCKMIGARLPTAEEFDLFRQDMGHSKVPLDDNGIPGRGSYQYACQVLGFQDADWTSSPVKTLSDMFIVFTGGEFESRCDNHACVADVRCVINTMPVDL